MKYLILIFISILFILSCSTKKCSQYCHIVLEHYVDGELDSRIDKDSVKCWINDTLVFNDVYKVNFDTFWNTFMPQDLVQIKYSINEVKFRIKLVSLDSVMFNNEQVADTTFFIKTDGIPAIKVLYVREYPGFQIFDIVHNPEYFELEY